TMNTAAKIGLLKMDFLGLANLTTIGRTLELIRKTRGVTLDMSTIPRDDARSFDLLGRGDTMGIFQLEGTMMRRYIKELQPSSVGDLAAMVALYRPGPMAHIPKFIASKNGLEPVEFAHPLLEPILGDTYGIIVFQEQVLQIVRAIAGFSLGQADIFRKVMSKKKREEMAKQRVNFMTGAKKTGIAQETAEKIFDLIEPFAGYAFNRAHASCYAWVAYETAYLKGNYPVEYMVAVLETETGDTTRVAIGVAECRRLGIAVLPPDINKSEAGFTIESTPQGQVVRFGMLAIKNVSGGALETIAAARKDGGAFRNIDDFCHRVDLRSLNKRVLECLIKAGAMDCLGNRGQLLAALDKMISLGQQAQAAAAAGQTSLFDFMPMEAEISSIALPDVPNVSRKEQLSWEKELMGLYLSSHPAEQATLALEDTITAYADQLSAELAGQVVTMVGVVASTRQLFTKKKDTMLVAQVEDVHGAFEVVVFPRTYKKTRDVWQDDAILVIKGKVDARDDDRMQVLCEDAIAYSAPPAGERAVRSAGVQAPTGTATTTMNGNGHTNGNGNGRGNGYANANGNGQANGNGNGYANGNGGGGAREPEAVNGASARKAAKSGGRHHLHLIVRRGEDAQADVDRFRQACSLLYANGGGQDSVDLTIAANGHEAVDLEFPDLRVRYSQHLHEQIVALLGPDALELKDVPTEE
ncbi:MAG: DNA polymerase III subunit alpha, partial [Chloroflexota bacterium]